METLDIHTLALFLPMAERGAFTEGTIAPSYSSSQITDFNVRTIQFGEGYRQSVPIGLNSVRRTWNLTWENGDKLKIELIARFLRARMGAEAFLWSAPGDFELNTDGTVKQTAGGEDIHKFRKWVCESVNGPNYLAGNTLATLRVVFEEVFDL